MGDLGVNLHFRCRVDTGEEGDRFVGIKADSNGTLVYFPMGYRLPQDEQELQREVLQLINVLQEFMQKKDKVLHMPKNDAPQSVDFPINAYMNIIRDYRKRKGYYKEKERVRKTSDHGRIDWATSLKKNVAYYQEDGSPFFDKYTVVDMKPNEREWITKIHKYCVYESYQKLGCFFIPDLPADPHIPLDARMFLSILNSKLRNTNNSDEKLLFQSMIAMLKYKDEETKERQFFFGTDRFEYVWENLIDTVFGIRNKEDYFPRTYWNLRQGNNKRNNALEPDTIMLCNDKIYVLDAKYYRYGITGEAKHLPNSSSINKQITYAEYIQANDELRKIHGQDVPIYNAFLMPFNMMENEFSIDVPFGNIGEAKSTWKHDKYDYERVQGIVVDIHYLMHKYYGSHKKITQEIADMIDSAIEENKSLTVEAVGSGN